MIVTIDRGNTRTKLAVFNKEKIIFLDATNSFNIDYLKDIFNKYDIKQSIYCSVLKSNDDQTIQEYLCSMSSLITMSSNLSLPIINLYSTNNTLGNDRLADIVGAYYLYKKSTLVIDAGTCITYDFLNNKSEYIGGSISLGFMLKYKALHNFTANLPFINEVKFISLCCNTTKDCLISGVVNGTLFEIEKTIEKYKEQYGDINIVITGGDAEFIQKNLKAKTIIEENLILYGLKNILDINAK